MSDFNVNGALSFTANVLNFSASSNSASYLANSGTIISNAASLDIITKNSANSDIDYSTILEDDIRPKTGVVYPRYTG